MHINGNLCLVSLKFANVIKEFKYITPVHTPLSDMDVDDITETNLPFFYINEKKPTFDLLCDTDEDLKVSKQKITDGLLEQAVLEEKSEEKTILKVEEDIIIKNKQLSDILHLKGGSSYKQKYLKYKQKYLELQKNKTI